MSEETKRTRFTVDKESVIRVKAAANPRRKGSKTFEIFEQYEDGMSVADFLEKSKPIGGGLVDLKADIERGHIGLEAAA